MRLCEGAKITVRTGSVKTRPYNKMTKPAAYLAIVLLGGIALFQAGLAAGKPWGRAAWGGQHRGVLPTRLRTASAIAAAAVYPLLIAYVASSAELTDGPYPEPGPP